jgi:hypothetical protein
MVPWRTRSGRVVSRSGRPPVAGESEERRQGGIDRQGELVSRVHGLLGHSHSWLRKGGNLLSHLEGDLEELQRVRE